MVNFSLQEESEEEKKVGRKKKIEEGTRISLPNSIEEKKEEEMKRKKASFSPKQNSVKILAMKFSKLENSDTEGSSKFENFGGKISASNEMQ